MHKSLESWIWDAACSIRGAKDAPKYKHYIFTKRLCDVFDDELDCIAAEVGSRKKAFQLAKAERPARRGSTSRDSEGEPKNFIPNERIQRIADTLIGWKEGEKLSRIVDHAELKKNDYNISLSFHIHTSDAETYRPIGEIVAELEAIEKEAAATDKVLRKILKPLGA